MEVHLRDGDLTVAVDGQIGRLLGFNCQEEEIIVFSNPGIYRFPSQEPDSKSYDPTILNVYCNIITPIPVGNFTANLLKAIPVQKQNSDNKLLAGEVSSRNYLPVNVQSFNDIEIQIRTPTGNLAPFSLGVVYLRLHFKLRSRFPPRLSEGPSFR